MSYQTCVITFDDALFDEDNRQNLKNAFVDCGMTNSDAEWILDWYPELIEGWYDTYDGDMNLVATYIREQGASFYGHDGCAIIAPDNWEQEKENYPEDLYLIFQDASLSGVICWPTTI